jgi:hypothetical protein
MEEENQVVDQTELDSEEPNLEELLSGIQSKEGQQRYADVETALKSIPFKDEHIEKLEAELAELREKAKTQQSLDDAVSQLRNELSATSQQPTQSQDPVDFNKIVDERLKAKEVEQQQQRNVDTVLKAFTDKFGDRSAEAFKATASDNGLNIEFLKELATRSPEAVLNLAGIRANKVKDVPKTHSSVNAEGFQPAQQQQQPRRSIMGGASTKEVLDVWRSIGTQINQE